MKEILIFSGQQVWKAIANNSETFRAFNASRLKYTEFTQAVHV